MNVKVLCKSVQYYTKQAYYSFLATFICDTVFCNDQSWDLESGAHIQIWPHHLLFAQLRRNYVISLSLSALICEMG